MKRKMAGLISGKFFKLCFLVWLCTTSDNRIKMLVSRGIMATKLDCSHMILLLIVLLK